ncbi:MAG: pantoate--beta-alanine ligase [Chloroflexi bacterium]|nr:MAG: pantoate--beta-alanine ligase [Chloroflexota bacterium]
MGYLHDGHVSLVNRAKSDNDSVVVSIFINPKQFDLTEDLTGYPRNLQRDIKILEDLDVNFVFVPEVSEIYPENYATYVDVGEMSRKLEGSSRPGHFLGVTTVVTKLFNVIRPDRAYFGQKDGQQAVIVKRLVRDLNFETEIVIVPTVREYDGLAMSSRNSRLTEQQREAATVINRALSEAIYMWESGVTDSVTLRRTVEKVVSTEPLAKLDYVSISDVDTLDELNNVYSEAMISVAVWFDNVRLIDNKVIGGNRLE